MVATEVGAQTRVMLFLYMDASLGSPSPAPVPSAPPPPSRRKLIFGVLLAALLLAGGIGVAWAFHSQIADFVVALSSPKESSFEPTSTGAPTTVATSEIEKCFTITNNKVYDRYGTEIRSASANSFVNLKQNPEDDGCYAKDAQRVYYEAPMYGSNEVVGADPATFRTFKENGSVGADKNGLYVETSLVDGVDQASWMFVSKKWAKDKNSVYSVSDESGRLGHSSVVLKKVDRDLATFKVINDFYITDKNGAYYTTPPSYGSSSNKILVSADTATLSTIGGSPEAYAKDKNRVYIYGEALSGADPATFAVLENGVYKDKNQVYNGKDIVSGADATSYVVSKSEDKSTCYYQDKNNVYLWGKIVPNLDPATFAVIMCATGGDDFTAYTKDKNSVYLNGTKINGADPNTFEMVKIPDYLSDFAKDKNRVYEIGISSDDSVFSQADPSTFEVLRYDLVKDKNNVYQATGGTSKLLPNFNGSELLKLGSSTLFFGYQGKVYCDYDLQLLPSIDLTSFQSFEENHYFKDKNGYYAFSNSYPPCKSIVKASGKLVVLYPVGDNSGRYMKDEKSFYDEGKKVEGVDPKSVAILSPWFIKDKNGVYFLDTRVPNADPNTFSLVAHGGIMGSPAYAVDKNQVYIYTGYSKEDGYKPTTIAGADPSSFTVLNDMYSKDKSYVYNLGKAVSGADPASFKVTYDPVSGKFDPHDKNRHYTGFGLYRGQ